MNKHLCTNWHFLIDYLFSIVLLLKVDGVTVTAEAVVVTLWTAWVPLPPRDPQAYTDISSRSTPLNNFLNSKCIGGIAKTDDKKEQVY